MATLANERITTRVSSEIKELLERALSLSGYASLNSFIANAAVAEAKRLIEQNMRIQLCQEDALAFVHALEKPIKVNERFLRAARRHKETIKNEDRTSR
ncbi:DUF1778 domain-containing protein [Photorhabdus luminescens]|uniref:DUF1778 domain-containing protein n=3 Tax=Photorhabdus TaxID=29487 RepID=A0A0A0CQN0_9GAMM|nr:MULTISPECIES: DUF1778 domain-containing protein [Photorhabdus]KGM28711.1 hypothetical protein KS18_06640 [Photorhabdus luminescens]MBS9428666.1 DUF1778 domain-containing protein [Photorhabdus akhurstii]MBS9434122.1 DUF1778 domain-containing protein [Photorhabdus hainanensis]MCC8456593.1 DUF1778 domain-containing protein [Photorhabdus aegyptia]OCA53669.1 hypothetical protein Phpb_03221 [Photorhabdus namnaonensis]